MKIIEVKDYNEMSLKAAEYIIEKVINNPRIKLGLATGGTPVGTYKNLIADHRKNGTSYQHVTTFNLDEYIGLSGDNQNSYRYFMNEQLFNHIDVHESKTFIPSGIVKDMQAECLYYDDLIEKHGGIDLQLLGIGQNGHIGFNEPGTSFRSNTHVVQLAPSTIQANARFFNNIEEVPTKAITMGIASILRSKEILLLVSGESKNDAMFKLLNGELTENFPASALKKHPYVTIIADKAAVADLKLPC
ncbi:MULTISPECIES: glucosamine-6-phosphate deaminase [Neobacillus]|uniref:Glucosamine-6-phosphate deaminase n=1 Tax=Neobacillus rhizophilus TaxID=2833579 RepID=A0A942YSX1_9BACI|nr:MULTISPECIES: glucosamine-6-phosphate deaminase [Neobacillus]MBS4212338.1 glucosamine-6-phosphate deaminase [Neobacillus rhizophilus]MBU8915770.1 glucosamine-6-phosphate deaminase [Bacillus sp. FJAT-29953]